MYFAQAPSFAPPTDIAAATKKWYRVYQAWQSEPVEWKSLNNSPVPPWGHAGVNSAPGLHGWTLEDIKVAFQAWKEAGDELGRYPHWGMDNADFSVTIFNLENPDRGNDDTAALDAETVRSLKIGLIVGIPLMLLLAAWRA